jgi:hypothetical protein
MREEETPVSKNSMRPSSAVFGVAIATSLLLTGCGASNLPVRPMDRTQELMQAEATNTLMKGLARIHKAIFDKIDKDGNGKIDEYEAGPNLTLDDFRKADKNRNGKLTFTEFKNYATTNLFFFRDNPKAFTERVRSGLRKAFDRLDDSPRDGLLSNRELSNKDLKRLGLSFEYPRLKISVKISKVSDAAFAAADKTGDNKLGQAEFEDLYIESVIEALGGTPGGGGSAPMPADPIPPGGDPGAVPPATDFDW